MTLVEELKEILPRASPNLSEAVRQIVIDSLISSGSDSTEGLKYVKREDVGDLLPVIQQRKLLDAFKLGMFAYCHSIIIIYFFLKTKSCMAYFIFLSVLETETIASDLRVLPSPTTAGRRAAGEGLSPSAMAERMSVGTRFPGS